MILICISCQGQIPGRVLLQNGPLSKATLSLLRNRDCEAIPTFCPGHRPPPEAPLTSYVFSFLAAGSPLER